MAKGTIEVSVRANTKQAQKSVEDLRSRLEKTGIGSIGEKFKGIPGLEKFSEVLNMIPKGAGVAAGAIGGLVVAAKSAWDAMGNLVEKGREAEQQFQRFSTTMETLDRNFGGMGRDFSEIGKELQLMAANGSNSFESLANGVQSLTVAYQGNTSRALQMIKTFDDLASGTGVAVDDWAGMAAEVSNTGVSIKDLTRLSNKGIPIFQALGEAMGVAAEEAEGIAKAGALSAEDWYNAIDKLAERYKGLSKELSSMTLEGAQSSLDASRKLMNQGAAAGYSEVKIEGLNELSSTMQNFAKNPEWEATTEMLGKLRAVGENAVDKFGLGLEITAARLLDFSAFLMSFGASEDYKTAHQELKLSERQAKATQEAEDALDGKFTVEQLKDVLQRRYDSDLDIVQDDIGRRITAKIEKVLEEAEKAAAKQAKIDEANAKAESARQAQAKYGTLDEKVKAVSGKDGIPIILDPSEIQGAIQQIKKQMLSGDLGLKEGEDMIKTLQPIEKEYIDLLKAEENAKKEAADAAKKSAEEAKKAAEEFNKSKESWAKSAISDRDKAQAGKDKADNAVKEAMAKLEDAQIDFANRQAALREKGVYSGKELKSKIGKMDNYNDWMKLYDKSAAEGITRAEWRRKYGKAKDMSAKELERSGWFRKDDELSKEGAQKKRAEEELAKAQKEQKEATNKLKEASDNVKTLGKALGLTNKELEKLANKQSAWMDECIAAGVVKVKGVALAN